MRVVRIDCEDRWVPLEVLPSAQRWLDLVRDVSNSRCPRRRFLFPKLPPLLEEGGYYSARLPTLERSPLPKVVTHLLTFPGCSLPRWVVDFIG